MPCPIETHLKRDGDIGEPFCAANSRLSFRRDWILSVSVRQRPSGQGDGERTLWLCGHDLKVSTWSGDGHIQAIRERDGHYTEGAVGYSQATTADYGGEAADSRRDFGGGCVGGESGASAWGQRQPGLRLAEVVSRRSPGRRRRGQATARQRKRELTAADSFPPS